MSRKTEKKMRKRRIYSLKNLKGDKTDRYFSGRSCF